MEYLVYKIDIIRYLDKTEGLIELGNSAQDYIKNTQFYRNELTLPFFYTLKLDFPLLVEYAGSFAELLINEPDEAVEILKQIFQECVNTSFGIDLNASLINIDLRISCLPFKPEDDFQPNSKTGLFSICGILSGRSTVCKYMRSTVYFCLAESCWGGQHQVVFGSRPPPKCQECGKDKTELVKARNSGDHVFCTFMKAGLLNSPDARRYQGISVEFQDDLCSDLVLGIRYSVVVKRVQNGLCALGIQRVQHTINQIYLPVSPKIIAVYNEIRELCGGSPWCIVNFLASQLYVESYPVSAFTQLKTGLLLSLASVYGKFPVPILALGDCDKVMSSACRLSRFGVNSIVSLSTSPTGEVVMEANGVWLEAGPLLLASQGILYIGNVPKINSLKFKQIASAVESEKITLCHKTICSTFEPSILTYPLQSAVWTHWTLHNKSQQEINHLKTLINVFGLPFLSYIGSTDEIISTCLLNEAAGSILFNNDTILDQSILKEIVELASAQVVEISPTAVELIRNYFVASRRERPEALPVKSIKIISSLAEAHARISMRSIVTDEDVIAVIFLYEETISSLFGPCVLKEPPKRDVNGTDSFQYVKQMDVTLEQFKNWLEEYINLLIGYNFIDDKFELKNVF